MPIATPFMPLTSIPEEILVQEILEKWLVMNNQPRRSYTEVEDTGAGTWTVTLIQGSFPPGDPDVIKGTDTNASRLTAWQNAFADYVTAYPTDEVVF